MTRQQYEKTNRLSDIEENYLTMSEEDLKHMWIMYYPGGSGPIGMMYQVTGLIQAVAKLRGIDTSEWKGL